MPQNRHHSYTIERKRCLGNNVETSMAESDHVTYIVCKSEFTPVVPIDSAIGKTSTLGGSPFHQLSGSTLILAMLMVVASVGGQSQSS